VRVRELGHRTRPDRKPGKRGERINFFYFSWNFGFPFLDSNSNEVLIFKYNTIHINNKKHVLKHEMQQESLSLKFYFVCFYYL
jgi:hypothetical protein